MRVLLLDDEKLQTVEVLEIVNIGYDDDITNIKDDEGNYDQYNDIPISGLYMVETDGTFLYIEGISQNECNKICEEILSVGYIDLKKYGTYYYEWYYEYSKDTEN